MLNVIGKSLSEATNILSREGYIVEVVEYLSDKQKEWDSIIVVRQRMKDRKASLVVTNFKVRI